MTYARRFVDVLPFIAVATVSLAFECEAMAQGRQPSDLSRLPNVEALVEVLEEVRAAQQRIEERLEQETVRVEQGRILIIGDASWLTLDSDAYVYGDLVMPEPSVQRPAGADVRGVRGGRVNFDEAFETEPTVMAALCGIDSENSSTNTRIGTRVTSVDARGFHYTVVTWADSVIVTMELCWIAVGNGRH